MAAILSQPQCVKRRLTRRIQQFDSTCCWNYAQFWHWSNQESRYLIGREPESGPLISYRDRILTYSEALSKPIIIHHQIHLIEDFVYINIPASKAEWWSEENLRDFRSFNDFIQENNKNLSS